MCTFIENKKFAQAESKIILCDNIKNKIILCDNIKNKKKNWQKQKLNGYNTVRFDVPTAK